MLSFDRVTSSPSMTLTYLLFFIAPLTVAPTLTSPLLFSTLHSRPILPREVFQNLCSNHLPILLTVPLSPGFCPNEHLPFLNFWKARQDDFAFYFDSHCPSAEEHSSLFLSFAAVLYFSDTVCPPYDLVPWTDGTVPFPFGKDGSVVLANCSLYGIEATLFFSAGPVCSSISAEACAILHALCWSRQHQQVCHFSSLLLLSDPRSVLSFIFPFYLNLCQKLFSLFSSFIRLQWVPGHSFLPDDDLADKLARRGALLVPSAMPCSLSPLISRIHSFLFSDWRRTVSSKFFDTPVSSISTEELGLLRHARCVLSRLLCNGHSLLLSSYLSRIGRIENPSCSACGHHSSHSALSNYELFASLALRQFAVSLRPLSQALLSFPTSGAPWFSTINQSLEKGRVTITTAKLKLQTHYYVTKRVSKFRRS